jgi:hypothetical protein
LRNGGFLAHRSRQGAKMRQKSVSTADSDEDAQAFRFDGALDSDMMSPRAGASLAGDWWHR